ncbi:hypothetical protein Rsub_12137 [Raphidocelis subcapitata]|uniref:Pherophorin domain-containing protein n=1 Tax=Raphidocelis subcapitata TaxID=307507 RepID=A0A2V0PIS8_9CHLO|nr:hypothetical protein Rsub_12137 [Raphidocelis subcapitata]|eukprot:GBF99469.1 hypothetical protein Rsub_12137 [Raphidocelis subcapitata]
MHPALLLCGAGRATAAATAAEALAACRWAAAAAACSCSGGGSQAPPPSPWLLSRRGYAAAAAAAHAPLMLSTADCKDCVGSTAPAAIEIVCISVPGSQGIAAVGAAGCAAASTVSGANRSVCAFTTAVVKVTAAKAGKGKGLAAVQFEAEDGKTCTCGGTAADGAKTRSYEYRPNGATAVPPFRLASVLPTSKCTRDGVLSFTGLATAWTQKALDAERFILWTLAGVENGTCSKEGLAAAKTGLVKIAAARATTAVKGTVALAKDASGDLAFCAPGEGGSSQITYWVAITFKAADSVAKKLARTVMSLGANPCTTSPEAAALCSALASSPGGGTVERLGSTGQAVVGGPSNAFDYDYYDPHSCTASFQLCDSDEECCSGACSYTPELGPGQCA